MSKQEQLRAQIVALENQLKQELAKENREREATVGVLVAASPSPASTRRLLRVCWLLSQLLLLMSREAKDSSGSQPPSQPEPTTAACTFLSRSRRAYA
jgi:hypothetical protein